MNVIAAIVDKSGVMIKHFRQWVNRVDSQLTIEGDGSPEGVVDALPLKTYMDKSGGAGSVFWIKQLPDIAGDTTRGWVAIG